MSLDFCFGLNVKARRWPGFSADLRLSGVSRISVEMVEATKGFMIGDNMVTGVSVVHRMQNRFDSLSRRIADGLCRAAGGSGQLTVEME
jgi:hypothetical protein